MADVLVGSTLTWPARAGFPDVLPANLEDYVTRLVERPAYQRAQERTKAD